MNTEVKKTKKKGLFKTIRFNEKERIIYENWDYRMVREFKRFMINKLSNIQKIEYQIGTSDNPPQAKKRMIRDKINLIKFMIKKGASQERIEKLNQELVQLRSISLKR